jgi:hypothetical protein
VSAHASRTSGAAGVTSVEMLIATAILLTVMGALFTVVHPSRGVFQSSLEAADAQQRLRVAADMLAHDLRGAGAGPIGGPSPGPLLHVLAPVLPHRIGRRDGDVGIARPDTVAILSLTNTLAQATVRPPDGRDHLSPTDRMLTLAPRAHCPPATPLCGFTADSRALLFDPRGAWDLVTIARLAGDRIEIAYDGALSAAYGPDAMLAEASASTYYLRADPRAQAFQLRRYDGFESDLPLVDDVVGLAIEYLGGADPPRLRGGSAAETPQTTYGPAPPPAGEDEVRDTWGPGENCLFRVVAGEHVPRLDPLAIGGLVPLPPTMLLDGPWCPDEQSPHRFDADLLRVRVVRVRLRVQVASAALRGPAGVLFARGGTSRGPHAVPDLEVTLDVALRNVP